jgi:hypothetical protein
MRPPLRLLLAVREADRHLSDLGLTPAAGRLERLDKLGVWRDADQAVDVTAGTVGGIRLRSRVVDRRQLVRNRVDPRLLDGVVRSVVALVTVLPEQSDHPDRLLEHLEPYRRLRPAVAQHVLVQVLTGAGSKEEAAREHRSGRRGQPGR